jgi:hypothetical protein
MVELLFFLDFVGENTCISGCTVSMKKDICLSNFDNHLLKF